MSCLRLVDHNCVHACLDLFGQTVNFVLCPFLELVAPSIAVIPEEVALSVASRRMSVAPVNRAAASNIRNMSGRHGSMFYGRTTFVEGNSL